MAWTYCGGEIRDHAGNTLAEVRASTLDHDARLMALAPELLAALNNLINACKDLPAFYAGRTPCIELSLAMEVSAKGGN